jgi:16S rRNA (cytosine967-C5)-methyltransferase
MKLFRPNAQAVTEALREIFTESRYADKVIERKLRQDPRWGARDRRFIAESTYDVVRWYRKILAVSGAHERDFWTILGIWVKMKGESLPPWSEFDRAAAMPFANEQLERKVNESIPDWLDVAGENELGSLWDKELHALNEQAQVVLRANTLKISRKDLKAELSLDEVDTYTLKEFPDALVLRERQNVFQLEAFKNGLFEVQDAGSQAIAPFLKVEPGMRLIDACAGGGGKTLHLAALMNNKGKILALDTEGWKLEELKKRARRAGAGNIETRVIESSKVIKRLEATADRLLLDVPCSGVGVLKRNPDAKWKLTPQFMDAVKKEQAEILQSYSAMVKPGGLMVYATCSIFPSENENQVGQFISANSNFRKVDERSILPSEGFDGFYMASVERLK